MMKTLIFFFSLALLTIPPSWAKKTKRKKNAIVEYKKYQAVDLGDLQIDGRIIAPGNLTINENDQNDLEYPLFNRKHFRHQIIKDINNIR